MVLLYFKVNEMAWANLYYYKTVNCGSVSPVQICLSPSCGLVFSVGCFAQFYQWGKVTVLDLVLLRLNSDTDSRNLSVGCSFHWPDRE